MQRKSFVSGAALVAAVALAVGLTGCTAGSGADGDAADAKGGNAASSSAAAQPGRYQTLPEACGLPAPGTVRGMLPGDGAQPSGAEAEKIYAGQADVTYDTDRRVGCHWKRETTAGTRHLSLDIQRVVSYDSAVSDDDKAQEIYANKELAAKIPSDGSSSSASSSASSSPSASKGKETGKDGDDKDGDNGKGEGDDAPESDGAMPGDPSGTSDGASAGASAGASTAPRVLDDLGDAAFLNDRLITTDSGVHRDITVVFRTSNVIVTITYDQWSTDKRMLPGSQELQDKARSLASELAERFSE
ncbi:hypothetical protein [Streptomyces halobius]|uniref:DUF3558 domain-containing protein n=1 Tax=Streptomyces halobius TaxID=2879846 RepID=A0ABY4MA67_9ACTN|nr:hypothetical protein [Streptomyces halobius]UQA94598.1 hypothetical protein K9S39_24525 [Streptomyces halobius]